MDGRAGQDGSALRGQLKSATADCADKSGLGARFVYPCDPWSFVWCVGCDLFGFSLVEEVDHVVFPDGGLGVGAVASGGVGDGDEDEAGVGDLLDHRFGDA